MAEIFGGNGLHKAFKALNIEAKRTYKSSHEPYYEVWELNKKDLKVLEEIMEWDNTWGWWRNAKGSNMGTACSLFVVNGKELIAWDGPRREDLRNDWDNESDEEKAACHYRFKEYEEIYMPHTYDTLLEYMRKELCASMESNICALAVDLARVNGVSMGRLFEMYEG